MNRLTIAVCLLTVSTAFPRHAAAGMSAPEQRALAEAFAPEFIFHPEELFPCSPLLITSRNLWPEPPGTPPELTDGASLGDNSTRVAEYEALPRADRFRAATVYFRVRPIARDGGTLVVEYWLYYLANTYMVRGGLVPFHLNGAHAHDLERVFVVLEPRPASDGTATTYAIRTILTSAHTAGVPDNRYSARVGSEIAPPLRILVERGSHAMAADINGNLIFDAASDAAGYAKLVWGIRDFGDTWAHYRLNYAASRPAGDVVMLGYEHADADRIPSPRTGQYRLEPVDQIESRLAIEHWSKEDRSRVLGHTSWIKRLFGEVDTAQLLRPSAHTEGRTNADPWRRVAASESGITLGFTNINAPYSGVAGLRYAWLNDSRWPDLLLDGSAMFPVSAKPSYEATVFETYPVDAIARIVVGQALRWDEQKRIEPLWLAGVEWRLNRWRVRGTARNPHNRVWADFRIFYVF